MASSGLPRQRVPRTCASIEAASGEREAVLLAGEAEEVVAESDRDTAGECHRRSEDRGARSDPRDDEHGDREEMSRLFCSTRDAALRLEAARRRSLAAIVIVENECKKERKLA